MAIKMIIDGEEVEATTEEDVLMLLRAKRRLRAETGQHADDVNSAARWPYFLAVLSGNQRRALACLKANDGSTADGMAMLLGVKKNAAIGGLWSGVHRNAKKVGINPVSIFRRDMKGWGPTRVTRYYAGPLLLANDVPCDGEGRLVALSLDGDQ